jgi:TRAP-type C4-dicarboxylate transport system permease small subunit
MKKNPKSLLGFEHRGKPLLARPEYVRRLVRVWTVALGLVFGSLGIGILGYHYFCDLGWLSSLLNASMILFSEGPIDPTPTVAGKIWASFYALFSGVAFITIIGVIFAPVFHRFLHKFHLDLEETINDER